MFGEGIDWKKRWEEDGVAPSEWVCYESRINRIHAAPIQVRHDRAEQKSLWAGAFFGMGGAARMPRKDGNEGSQSYEARGKRDWGAEKRPSATAHQKGEAKGSRVASRDYYRWNRHGDACGAPLGFGTGGRWEGDDRTSDSRSCARLCAIVAVASRHEQSRLRITLAGAGLGGGLETEVKGPLSPGRWEGRLKNVASAMEDLVFVSSSTGQTKQSPGADHSGVRC